MIDCRLYLIFGNFLLESLIYLANCLALCFQILQLIRFLIESCLNNRVTRLRFLLQFSYMQTLLNSLIVQMLNSKLLCCFHQTFVHFLTNFDLFFLFSRIIKRLLNQMINRSVIIKILLLHNLIYHMFSLLVLFSLFELLRGYTHTFIELLLYFPVLEFVRDTVEGWL